VTNVFNTQAEVLTIISKLKVPDYVLNDLTRFIHETYYENLPNSLLIAQAFILKYPDHGKKYGLPIINRAIEYGIKKGLF
jgi:hypothetical protein